MQSIINFASNSLSNIFMMDTSFGAILISQIVKQDCKYNTKAHLSNGRILFSLIDCDVCEGYFRVQASE